MRGLPSWLLNQAALAANRLVADGLEGAVGAHRSQFAVLSALDEFGPASQADLGRRSGIDRSDMVALVNALSATGWSSAGPTRPTAAATSSPSPPPAAGAFGRSRRS